VYARSPGYEEEKEVHVCFECRKELEDHRQPEKKKERARREMNKERGEKSS